MLRLIKKHLAACKKTKEKEWRCVPRKEKTRVACPFYIVGPDPRDRTRPRIKVHTHTSDEQVAKQRLRDFELTLYEQPIPGAPKQAPPKTLDEAVAFFLATKMRTSKARQKKLGLQMMRLTAFLKKLKYAASQGGQASAPATAQELGRFNSRPEALKAISTEPEGLTNLNIVSVQEIEKTDLERFMNSWIGEDSTLRTTRENLKSFWKYCYDSEFTARNIAARLPTISDLRAAKERRIPTLRPDESEAIILTALKAISDGVLFKREGLNVALQVLAITYVQKYTGMAIGDATKLRLDALTTRNSLLVNRKKTGEPVFASLPDFAVHALRAFVPDSSEHFFWSGEGDLHSRTNKWHARLQKLYAASGVRAKKVEKTRRSGGRLKEHSELVQVSEVTPHWWRHTFVRDCYLRKPYPLPVEDIADLLGDDPATIREFYSSFDVLRQEHLRTESASIWADDPLTRRLIADHASSTSHVESTTMG